jgi:Etoposide-induced protein 2.4 (EI24)
MHGLLDSFWRAAAYCLHPRVIALSLLPLVLMVAAALGLGYFFWDAALDGVNATLEGWSLVQVLFGWLEGVGLTGLKTVLAPLIVVLLATPVIAITALLAVATLMTPSMLSLVAERRFPQLERKRGGSFAASVVGSLGATVVALAALLVSIPLWFVPPLVLVLPPLIWGWLTYRVLTIDVLAEHASHDERVELMRENRMALLGMGVLTGYLGAAPGLVWASGVLFVALAPVLVPVAIWIYTLVFAFAALWFTHFCLAALHDLRARRSNVPPAPPPPGPGLIEAAPSPTALPGPPVALPPP